MSTVAEGEPRLSKLAADNAGTLTYFELGFDFRDNDGQVADRFAPIVDEAPGVYVAWLTTNAALRGCGIDGEPPVALYVGKAETKRGLKDRLELHIKTCWLELIELLALHGEVPLPIGARRDGREGEGYRLVGDPLTDLAVQLARDWKYENVFWSWVTCPAGQAAGLETVAINAFNPLLNLLGRQAYPPPLLGDRVSAATKAQWLWYMSWSGLLVGTEPSRLRASDRAKWKIDESQARYTADKWGYPLPPEAPAPGRPALSRADLPSPRELFDLFVAAENARGLVRHALAKDMRRDELELWWAAHAASPLLPRSISVPDALLASLNMVPVAKRPGPSRLPSPERCEELWRLTTRLPRFRN